MFVASPLPQPDPVALADAQRRELKRQEREVAQHWNAYVRMMNGVMSKLGEGTVDIKLYQMALGEWEDLQKCEGWPYRWVTKDKVGKVGGKK